MQGLAGLDELSTLWLNSNKIAYIEVGRWGRERWGGLRGADQGVGQGGLKGAGQGRLSRADQGAGQGGLRGAEQGVGQGGQSRGGTGLGSSVFG